MYFFELFSSNNQCDVCHETSLDGGNSSYALLQGLGKMNKK
jgi:hypothetical protein